MVANLKKPRFIYTGFYCSISISIIVIVIVIFIVITNFQHEYSPEYHHMIYNETTKQQGK